MTTSELHEKLKELRSLAAETEVVEFKEAKNDFDFNKLGRYFSALANEANLKDKNDAWLVFGIEDKHRNIVGSGYRHNRPHLDSLKGEIAGKTSNRITFIEIYELHFREGRVVLFQIPAAPQGLPIAWDGHYYGRDGEELSPLNLEEIERIRKQATRTDWSAGFCPDASIDDLDTEALQIARENFKIKNPRLASEIDSWDTLTFLNKAKVAINGKLTRTSIILLGKPEAEHFIAPAVGQITWVLKDKDNIEKDYQHFFCPFISAIDSVYAKIRNLKYRYLKDGTLFPDEIDQYDPFNIKEALSNCIAHQDYNLAERINVIEREDAQLIFSNAGEFLPGSVEAVIESDVPPSYYRNQLLAQAMMNFNIIDTVGSGIKRMFRLQRKRYFPMPEYELNTNKVKVTLFGKVLDIGYARVLAKNPDLSLEEIILLDKVQKRKLLDDHEIKLLRDKGLIEGKKPNIIISAKVAQATGQKAAYTRNKAFHKRDYFDWIIRAIKDHGSLSRKDIEDLLWDKLSDMYNEQQKKTKVANLIAELRRNGVIINKGSDSVPVWELTDSFI
jgi:ATP-dependent DNA helicase RecG